MTWGRTLAVGVVCLACARSRIVSTCAGPLVAVADSVGRFRLASVPAGRYVLDVRRVRYHARRDTLVVPAHGVALDLTLDEVAFEGGCVNPETQRMR